MYAERRRWKNREFGQFRPFAYLNMLTDRVVGLEYRQLHKNAYNLVVYEFGGFENVLRDVGVRTIPT